MVRNKSEIWVTTARVVDMRAFERLRGEGMGAQRIGRGLGVAQSAATKLLAGTHWQQEPARVRLFNELRGATLEVGTGYPSDEDLRRFGGPRGEVVGKALASARNERGLFEALQATGVSRGSISEAVRRIEAMGGKEPDLPAKVDTTYLLQEFERKLARALAFLDDVVMASASPRDLTAMVSMLLDKRQLLRGEPTQIVRTEHREKLESLLAKAIAESRRRGIVLDVEAKVVGTT